MITTKSTEELREVFKAFTTEQSRYEIDSPWVKNGWLYATNARVVVRCPVPDMSDPERKVPDVNALDWEPSHYTEPLAIPMLDEIPNPLDCEKCNGKGIVKCENCIGGSHECDCGNSHVCGFCGGTRKSKCEECDGTGKETYLRKQIPVGTALFSDVFLWKLVKVGVKELRLNRNRPEKYAAYFTFDDCEGLIMPMEPER